MKKISDNLFFLQLLFFCPSFHLQNVLFVNVSSIVIKLEYCFYLTLNSNQSIYLFKAKYKTCPIMLSVYTLYQRFPDFVYLSRINAKFVRHT